MNIIPENNKANSQSIQTQNSGSGTNKQSIEEKLDKNPFDPIKERDQFRDYIVIAYTSEE